MDEVSVQDCAVRWLTQGMVVMSIENTPLTLGHYERISLLCGQIPTTPVSAGDMGETHALEVGRFKTDIPEPTHLSDASREIEGILTTPAMHVLYKQIFGRASWSIQRLQLNVIRPGGYIGAHVDMDSDLRRQVAMVLHLAGNYEGGAYAILSLEGSELRVRSSPGTLVFSRGDLLHRVEPVTRGERRTLAGFLFSGDVEPFETVFRRGHDR